ncbi:MAG: M36 family metallopeptidase, partial [Acidobacteriota bacterium]
MTTPGWGGARRVLLFTFLVFGITATVLILPSYFRSEAGSVKTGSGLLTRTASQDDQIPNYDIRSDKDAIEKIAGFRGSMNRAASDVADVRDSFVRGEEKLRSSVPTLKVEYNSDIRTPEVIGPDVALGRQMLTAPSGVKRSDILRGFLKQNTELVGARDQQINDLKTAADYTNPDGNLSFVILNQEIDGIPVFRGEVKAGFNKSGEMIRVINNLAPGLEYSSLSSNFADPSDAVRAAAGYIKHDLNANDLSRNAADSTDIKTVFGQGDWATTAEKMYFPTEPGVAVPAWRVLIWQPASAYYIIVDAQTGTMLWRKNIGEDQTQAATYNVYTNPNAMINSADNPSPLTPGPVTPVGPIQPSVIARTNVTRIGNEAPYTFNTNGWVNDGANITDGNAVEAGVDRVAPNGVDATMIGTPNRVFSSTWNPPPGNPAPGDDPLLAESQRGSVIQMFYIMNLYHDEMYRLGFTEQAFNFQNDNFGRGGAAADRVSAEGQDSSGTNNANFNTPADGGRGRMQMYLWTGPTPDYDGTTDADIIIHEVTHGTSNRLHGNASGLTNNMSRGMGEGWGDFYGHSMLSEPTDPLDGVYTTGGYATYLGATGYTSNYYYGIRRFPKAIMSSTGGPNNRPHNPLTFGDLNAGCVLTDGAFARGPFGVSQCDAVHNAGEIWSSMLWEVRAKYIARLGWAVGNRRILQHVTDGMKLAPIGPTFVQERDAIIAGAIASGSAADVADLWAGFAVRGMGFSARVTASGAPAVVVEGFDLPNLLQTPTFTVSDAGGNNNGFPEPGETLSLSIPLSNSTGNPATGTTLQVVGGGTANYGTIANGATASQTATFTVPAGTVCGSSLTLTFNVNSSLGATSFTRSIVIGVPVTTYTENFDGVTAPAFPAGWTAVSVASGINFVTTTTNSNSAPNSAFAADPTTVGGGSDLTSPAIPITASAATISFRNRFDTEAGWDGGALEISIAGGAFNDIESAGGSFLQNGYNGTLGAGANNPMANRNAWSGDSGGYITTVAKLPAAAAGQSVQFKWRFGGDDNTAGSGTNPGWNIDNVAVVGSYNCGGVTPPPAKSRADFDGDGKTD